MKDALRSWLGISQLEAVVLHQANTIEGRLGIIGQHGYEMFHTLPFVSGIMALTAADAAKFTVPEGIEENSLLALLTGIVAQARQGNSSLQVEGELAEATHAALIRRGFKVEDHEGTGGKSTFIIWT